MAGNGQKVIGRKIAKVRREGKSKKQAAGKAFGMARSGSLGPAAQSHARAHKPRKRAHARKRQPAKHSRRHKK